jgi:membrane fusion protein, multidrug efflux system
MKIVRTLLVMLVMLAIVGGGLGYVFYARIAGFMHLREHLTKAGPPPVTVSATPATLEEWVPQLRGVGSLRAVNGANLSTQVGGIVSAIHFESGSDVAQGTLLVELSAADDIAKLKALQATAALARITLDRDQRQLKIQGVSQQTVDADAQNLKAAEAQVGQQQATVDYKFIRAPFAGRLGIRQIDLGQYLSPGTAIVTLQALDPLFVDFYLPQQTLEQIRIGQKVTAYVDTYPGEGFSGEITAINPEVDPSSRNLQVRATLKNPDHRLLPGMYATIDIAAGKPQRFVTLPQTAIAFNPYGATVWLVEKKGDGKQTARQTFVKTGDTRGDQIAVLEGVKEGDMVVTAGQIKLRKDVPVIINNSIQPTADASPKLPTDR